MAEKVLGKDAVMAQVERITTAINRYTSDPELLYQVRNDVAEMLETAAK